MDSRRGSFLDKVFENLVSVAVLVCLVQLRSARLTLLVGTDSDVRH